MRPLEDEARQRTGDEIAIIGMAGRFPSAPDIHAFWKNLHDGVEATSKITADDLAAIGVDPAVLDDPDYVSEVFAIEEPYHFDAQFFGLSPREAETMDPQHRFFLEAAYTALEHAGYDANRYEGLVGVFGGVGRNSYLIHSGTVKPHLFDEVGEYYSLIGNERDFPTTRVSYLLDLHGPSMNVQSACSTSGAAVHLARQSLLVGDCDIALAGGCKVIVPNREGYWFIEGGPLAPEGHIRAFDADARGMVRGSGVAMLVLKRLDDAIEDGDTVHGVILGSAVNNDGSAKVGFTAPSVNGQAEVIAEALEVAGIGADSVSYVEAHGTGTRLGDPIEVAGLTRAYRETSDRKGFCALGSVKTNIGHLDAGATAAGIIKTVLAMQHQKLPASLNFSKPNPEIDFESSPFYVNASLQDWPVGDVPRRAGVSSFGLGGTNVHVIVEEPPELPPSDADAEGQILVLSAGTESALSTYTGNLAEHLRRNPDAPLADIAYTLQVGRRELAHRRIVVAQDTEEAVAALDGSAPSRTWAGTRAESGDAVVFMFPGGGAQYAQMAAGLYSSQPVFRHAIDECAAIVREVCDLELLELLYPEDPEAPALTRPSTALPALLAVEYALAKLWMSMGVMPAAMIGHSMGEYTAACLAGVFSVRDALRLVACRGRLFETLPAGAMLSVPLSENELRPYLGVEVDIAAANTAHQCVASGSVEAIEALESALAADDIEATRVHIDVAAHSSLVQPILDEFREFVATIELSSPAAPLVSNVTGTWMEASEATDPEYWVRHLRQTVRFADGLQTVNRESPAALLEVGPGQTLSIFGRALRGPGAGVASSLRHPREQIDDRTFFLQALGQLWLVGVPVHWDALHDGRFRRRVPVPTYPFERKHYNLISPEDYQRPSATEHAADTREPTAPTSPALPSDASTQPTGTTPVSPPVNEMPNEATPVMDEQVDRKSLILAELSQVISRLSGIEPADLDPSRTFLELGFDSLFLAQANSEVKKVFKVRLTTRQLMEKLPTLGALTEHLDETLPADKFQPKAPEPVAASAPAASTASPDAAARVLAAAGAGPMPADGSIQALIAEQLRIMQGQLDVLRGAGADGAAIAAPTSVATATVATAAAAPAAAAPAAPTDDTANVATPDSTSPWQPVQASSSSELTAEQQRHLDALMVTVQSRTPESKRMTQENRRQLADPRTVQGFKNQWKEIVYPIVSNRAEGSKLIDIDGNEYIDLVNGYGVNFLGHAPEFVLDAVREQIGKTVAIGPQTPLAGEVAKLVCELTGMERAAFCNTGSEAVLAAIRMARTVTGKTKLITFSGHYHGIFDEVLVKGMGAGATRKSMPIAPGIPAQKVEDVIVCEYGNPDSLDIIRENADDVALVLVEPVRSRNPDLQPREFLHDLRAATKDLGIPLLFDEMVTGFRSHPGGAQEVFGVRADLATYGKVVGGGFPIGVVTGSAEYMDALDGGFWEYGDDSVPEADMTWFAGTFVRHPAAMAAAKATLEFLKEQGPELQEGLNRKTAAFVADLNDHFRATGAPIWVEHFASFFMVTFTSYQPYSPLLYYHLHNRGVMTYGGRPAFFTLAHTDEDIAHVAQAFKESVTELQSIGLLAGEAAPADAAAGLKLHADGTKELPLTEPQREVWIATQFGDEASSAFNLSIKLLVDGALDTGAMQRAVQGLVDRHEVLRATFDDDNEIQQIRPKLEIEVPIVDLTEFPESERAARADDFELEQVKIPYDLGSGPLVRARLVKLGDEQWRVLVFVHHIVADGWSCGVMSRDLGRLYTQERGGEFPDSKPVMPFSEYWKHLQDDEQQADHSASEEFWLQEYSLLPQPLDVPSDRPRPAIKTYAADRISMHVDSALVKKCKKAAAEEGATLFAFTFAAWDAYLNRLTGAEDIVVGFDLAGQALVPDKDLVGHCVSFLPLRMNVDADESFQSLVSRMRGKLFDVMDNQHYTYGSLLQRLRVPPDTSRLPLVSVSFNLDPSSLGVQFDGLQVTSDSIPRQFENNDLFVNLVQLDDGSIELQCTYNLDLFDRDTVERRMREFVTLLGNAAANPSVRISALDWLPEDERSLTVEAWNDTDVEMPDEVLHALIAEQAAQSPQAVAVVAESGVAPELTYAELDRRADALAVRLQKMGVERDTPVAVCMERSAELVVALLGVLKAGGAYVPVDPGYPEKRRAFMLEDCGAPVLLTQAHLQIEASAETLEVDTVWDELTEGRPESLASPDSLAYIIYTSGSTGQPKGAMIEHRSIVNRLIWMRDYLHLTPSDVVLQKTPYSFDVSVWEFFLPLLTGARLVMARPDGHKDPDYLAAAIGEHGVTTLHFVPSMLHAFVADADLSACGSLQSVVCSGEALSPALRDRVLEGLDVDLYNLYGPTEAAVDVSAHRCTASVPSGTVPLGRPVANTRLYVLDGNGEPCPIGVPGELFIGGVQVARGYWNRPELTAERFVDDHVSGVTGARLYRTGDLCRFLPNGEIEFLGRLDDQVKVRGFRIELGEIESALEGLGGVQQAVVAVQEISPGNEALVAYLRPSNGAIDTEAARATLGETLPEYMVPQHWMSLDEIPLTANGKVDRRALPAVTTVAHEREPVELTSDFERRLAGIWSEVLGVSNLGASDNFFELGGHSILAARVATRVRRDLQVELPLRKIFTSPTLAELAGTIETLAAVSQMGASGEDGDLEEEVVL